MPRQSAVYRYAIFAVTAAAFSCMIASAAEAQTEEHLDFWLRVAPDRIVNSEFDRTNPVCRAVGRKTLVGCNNIFAQIQIQTLPCADRAVFRLCLSGSSVANNANVAGKHTIQTADTSRFCVTQILSLDANGVVAARPSASASARRQFLSARSSTPLLRDLLFRGGAWGTYRLGQKPINKAATKVVVAELRKEYLKQQTQLVHQWKQFYDGQIRTQIEQLGLNAERLQFSSSSSNIEVKHFCPTAEVSAPPRIGDQPLQMCLHQSAINRRLHESFSGKTLTDSELDEAYGDMIRLVNLPAIQETDEKPWSMKFAQSEPFSIKFKENAVELKIRGDRFQSEDRSSPAMELTVDYQFVQKESGWIARRAEEIQVFPPDFEPGTRLGVRQQVLRTVLRRRFNRLLPLEISFADLDLGTGNGEASRKWPLSVEIDAIVANNGWIGIGIMNK